ncbi:MAG: hypothetical protein OEY94_05100 [Alphaproteobacteria bacterium]|nr:hypothetical protein [Alphaproteobacteria bacterium]
MGEKKISGKFIVVQDGQHGVSGLSEEQRQKESIRQVDYQCRVANSIFDSSLEGFYGDGRFNKIERIRRDAMSGTCSIKDKVHEQLVGLYTDILDASEERRKTLETLRNSEHKEVRDLAWQDTKKTIEEVLGYGVIASREIFHEILDGLSKGPLYQEGNGLFSQEEIKLDNLKKFVESENLDVSKFYKNIAIQLEYKGLLLDGANILGKKGDNDRVLSPRGEDVLARLKMELDEPKPAPKQEASAALGEVRP